MNKFLFLIISISLSAQLSGQNKRYISAMERNLKMMDTCTKASSYQQTANAFERVANAEKKEWLPAYYVGLCNAFMASMSAGDKIDEYCDIAEKFAGKADSLSPNNSEVYALRSLIYSQRIGVNPMLRGAKFGGKSSEMNAKAKELDPSNPRPYLLDAQGKFYTPAQFGGGKERALPLFEEAVKKFESFKALSTITPDWGKQRAISLLAECKKK
jgi:hypothetical protein